MKNPLPKIFKLATLLIFLSFLICFLYPDLQSLIFSFSPQSTVNPQKLNGEFNSNEKTGFFNNKLFQAPGFLAEEKEESSILGQNSNQKRIDVDLTSQQLYAYEGDRLIYKFLISSGKWGRTPTGNFLIWAKLRYTKMEGGSKALRTYYYLPNVPYVMFFYNKDVPQWRGFGIHGAYWHNNFGHPMSHGCINMKNEDAALLYQWAMPDLQSRKIAFASKDNPGTPIVIYGTAPN